MTLGRYVLGLAYLGVVLGSLAAGSCCVRARLVPRWRGAPARLAETILVIAALCAESQILGTVGLFRALPVAIAAVALGVAALVCAGPPSRRRPRAAPGPPVHVAEGAIVIGALALVGARWSTWVAQAFDFGIGNSDSVWYHLPIAARFVQTGSLTHLHFLNGEALVTYYPANVPLLHAIGMLAFGRDVLSLVLNVGALAIALLGGWCIGRHWRQGPAGLLAVAVALSLPAMVPTMAGTAKDDVFAIAFLLAAIALLLESDDRSAPLALSGAAAGLALASKLTMLVPVGVLGLGVLIVLTRSGHWRRAVVAWGGGAFATGTFWYFRNLVAIGNPVPGLGRSLAFLPFPTPATTSYARFGSTVADFFFDNTVWRKVFVPGAAGAFGRAGPLLLLVAGIAVIAVLFLGRGMERAAGVSALAVAVAYPFTPGTAYGANVLRRVPSDNAIVFLFGFNLRYVVPGIGIALCLLVSFRVNGRPRTPWPVLGTLAVALVLLHTGQAGGDTWIGGHDIVAVLTVVVVALAGLLLWARQRTRSRVQRWRRIATAVTLLGVIGVPLAAWPAVQGYFDGRYSLVALDAWARKHHHVKIAVGAFPFQYPLYGPDLSNDVQYVGQRGDNGSFAPITSCTKWRHVLRADHYDFVVVPQLAPTNALGFDLARWRLGLPGGEPPDVPPETRWTRNDPGLRLVDETADAAIYRVGPTISSTGCPPVGSRHR